MKLLKVIGGFLSFVLSVIFFVILFCFITVLFCKNFVKEETIYNYIKEVDLLDLSAEEFINEEDLNLNKALNKELNKYGVTDNLFNEIIEESKIEHLMANFSSKYIGYVLFDEVKPVLLESDITNILNTEMIESYGNRILTRKEKEDYKKFISNTLETVNDNLPDKEEILIKENIPYLEKTLDIIYMENFNLIIISLLVGMFLLIALFTWSLYKPFGFLGVPTIILGSILIIIFFVQKIGIRYLITSNGTIESFTKNFINVTFSQILIYGIIVLGSGIVMLIIHSVISKIINNKEFVKKLEKKPKRKIIQTKKIEKKEEEEL